MLPQDQPILPNLASRSNTELRKMLNDRQIPFENSQGDEMRALICLFDCGLTASQNGKEHPLYQAVLQWVSAKFRIDRLREFVTKEGLPPADQKFPMICQLLYAYKEASNEKKRKHSTYEQSDPEESSPSVSNKRRTTEDSISSADILQKCYIAFTKFQDVEQQALADFNTQEEAQKAAYERSLGDLNEKFLRSQQERKAQYDFRIAQIYDAGRPIIDALQHLDLNGIIGNLETL